MKDKKSLLLFLPVLVFALTFLIMNLLDNRSYAATDSEVTVTIPEGAVFNYPKKDNCYSSGISCNDTAAGHNFYSHYLITNNRNWEVGLKKITSSNEYGGSKVSASVYCAEHGQNISTADHKRYSINSDALSLDDDVRDGLNKIMKYAYPYMTLSDLKTALQDSTIGIGAQYSSLDFAHLNAQEAITATQAAIWNIIYDTNQYKYQGFDKDVAGFNTCENIYEYSGNRRILTSEEETWAQSSNRCSTSGDFYKNLYVDPNSGDAKITAAGKRIDALITWYITTVKNNATEATDKFKLYGTPEYSVPENGKYNAVVKFKTNMTDYEIIFRNKSGTDITNSSIGATVSSPVVVDASNGIIQYTISNIPTSVKTIKVKVISNVSKKNVYWYTGSGQEFIGVENTSKTPLSLKFYYKEHPGNIVLYKVTGATENVKVEYRNETPTDNACGGNNQPTCLSGAKFELYYEGKNDDNLIKTFTIKNGKFEISDLEPGDYYLKEIQPPVGYDLYPYGQGAVDDEGFIKVTIADGQTATIIANNQPTNICFKKVSNDNTSEVLDGASFNVEDQDGQVFDSFVTSKQDGGGTGKHCIPRLPIGTYYLKEVDAPTGFSLPAKPYVFKIGGTVATTGTNVLTPDNTGTITVTNRKGLTMSKTDLTDGACVSGALLIIKDSQGEEVTRWKSTCSGNDGEDSYTVPICTTTEEQQAQTTAGNTCLTPGDYTLTENIHPEGYATAETISFTIKSDGKVEGDANMKDAPIEVCIYKVKKDTKEVLTGAEFEVYTKKSNQSWSVNTGSSSSCLSTITPIAQDDDYIYEGANTCYKNYEVVYEDGTKEIIGDALASGRVSMNELLIKGLSITKRERTEADSDNSLLDDVPYFVSNDKAKWNLYKQFTSSSEPCIPYMPTGDYLVKETKAPDGYALPENNTTVITVLDKAGHQDFYIENEVETPKTAMDSSITIVIVASIFMMFGIGLVGYYEYKKGH